MKLQGKTIKTIVADKDMLLTQAQEVAQEERIFSSKVYDDNLSNWRECSMEEAEKFETGKTQKEID